ncbi:MAG: hypothetical protein R8J94_08015 [Acidimicrobiia bacterium]|nr:hypothetical protein [Acidimicrobiia bacterium]
MEHVRSDAESSLLDVARRSRRARARMLRAKSDTDGGRPAPEGQIIDLTERGPRARLFGRSNAFVRSERPSGE